MTIKPFVKWVGGKTKLLKELRKNIPEKFENYFEPFVGGGALFFDLLKDKILKDKKIFISDLNSNLINCYQVIKESVEDLILELENKEIYLNEKQAFYKNRARYNEIKDQVENKVERASLFIYLNKTGFNGMYRENKSGKFNIPFGKMKIENVCDKQLLLEISQEFNSHDVEFSCCDFSCALNKVSPNDFVYIDSPYDETFTGYNKSSFGSVEQTKLKEKILSIKDVLFLISNSNTKLVNELYFDNNKNIISNKYCVNSKKSSRSKIYEEILIKITPII